MADTAMERCEVKRLFKVDGVKSARWVDVAVEDIAKVDDPQLRCAYCHGAIKLNKGGDYVLHRWRADGNNCQGGLNRGDAQSLSSKPVD